MRSERGRCPNTTCCGLGVRAFLRFRPHTLTLLRFDMASAMSILVATNTPHVSYAPERPPCVPSMPLHFPIPPHASPLHAAFQTGRVFWSSYVLLSLHVWMVIHRLRGSASPDVKVLRQRFYNAFQQDVEFRVYASGLQVCNKAGVC